MREATMRLRAEVDSGPPGRDAFRCAAFAASCISTATRLAAVRSACLKRSRIAAPTAKGSTSIAWSDWAIGG